MRLCTYQQDGKSCKNWIVNPDEEITMCPTHMGVQKRVENSYEAATRTRFEEHVLFCDTMDLDAVNKHILNIESLIEDFKIKLQAANMSKSKTIKKMVASGSLTQEQLEEMRALRSGNSKPREQKAPTEKLSKEEKEIQNLMKKGFSRENAIKLLND